MRSKSVVVAAIGLAVFIAGPSAGIADTQTGFYLARSPGSVRYLSLEGSGHDVTGFLEEIVIDQSGSDGEVRTQTSARRSANSISFDTYTATRNAHGYMLTSVTRSGRIVQRQFIQTSVPAINASVDALRVDADRIRARADIVSAKNQLTKYAAMSSLDYRASPLRGGLALARQRATFGRSALGARPHRAHARQRGRRSARRELGRESQSHRRAYGCR
jgi:hypothetical protein